jgi:hypothetical protein
MTNIQIPYSVLPNVSFTYTIVEAPKVTTFQKGDNKDVQYVSTTLYGVLDPVVITRQRYEELLKIEKDYNEREKEKEEEECTHEKYHWKNGLDYHGDDVLKCMGCNKIVCRDSPAFMKRHPKEEK